MRVALLTTFKAGRKEPLAVLLERIHAAFLASGQGEPSLRFSFSDGPLPGFVSSVGRVLKRYPQLKRFVTASAALPFGPPLRQITNGPASPAAGESIEFATLLAIAAGVPRSFPFHNLTVQLHGAAFGEALQPDRPPGTMTPGVIVGDSWWVNGRVRSLSALTLVDADPDSKKLPPLRDSVAAVLAACGNIKRTVQAPFAASSEPATAPQPAEINPVGPNPEAARAVRAIVQDCRTRFDEILDRAALRHDLPPASEALQSTPLGHTTGPKKPVLVRAFKPLGYDCHGDPAPSRCAAGPQAT